MSDPYWGAGPLIIPMTPGSEQFWAGVETWFIGDGTVVPRHARSDGQRAPLTRGSTPDLLTKREAARYLRMSERTFERQVLAKITRILIGGRQLIEFEELERWLESQKVGPSSATAAPVSGSSASVTRVVGITAQRAAAIEWKLKRARDKSSKRS